MTSSIHTLAATSLLILIAQTSVGQSFTPPAARGGAAHDFVPACGDPNYLSKTGSQCGGARSLVTSDPLQSPQNRVRCHPTTNGNCQPWYWCQQYARAMDIMFILDASMSIRPYWKNLMEVTVALIEELEEQVYPLVKCDTSTKNSPCDFRMGMQMWGWTNNNERYSGKFSCNSNARPVTCTTQSSPCKLNDKTNALQMYYADDEIPAQNWVSHVRINNSPGGNNYIKFTDQLQNGGAGDNMKSPMSPTRSRTRKIHGWANARDPAEWANACRWNGNTCAPPDTPITNQVGYLKWVAQVWHDDFTQCMPRTQWTKPFQDCLYAVRKENPKASQDDDAFRLCIMVTDGKPWRDGFPDGNNYENFKIATKDVKLAGVQTVGVFLQTGNRYEEDANHVYCIASCLDQTDYGKSLPGNDMYDFDKCYSYMMADSSRAKSMRDECKFYIDGNVKDSNNIDAIKNKVNVLVSNIAAASYTVSTQTSKVLECEFGNGGDLCENNRCLQVNREAWVCFEGFEQGTDSTGATTCTPCKPGHARSDWDGDPFCTVCGAGKFMPMEAGKTCSTCPEGQYTTSCVGQNDAGCACLASNQPGCQGVPLGQCPHEGCVRCKSCPVGRYAGLLNREGCSSSDGPPGCILTIGSQSPGTSCDACPVGWYGGGGSNSCTKCQVGFFSSSPGQEACSACPAGKYSDEIMSTDCKACPYGKTASATGASDCDPCGVGQRSVDPGVPGFGATDCTICAAGQVTPPASDYTSHSCMPCAVGKYRDSEALICETCEPGSWSSSEATEGSCPLCPAGKYGHPTVPAPCELCASGQKQAAAGQTSCTNCSAGEYSIPTEGNDGAHTCSQCVRGKKSDSPYPTHRCISCSAGQYNPDNGQASCQDCNPGYFQSSTGATICTSCAEVTPPNSYQDGPGKAGCKVCSNGEVSNPANTGCQTCAKGKYLASNGNCQQCQGCGPGEFNPTGCEGSQGACVSCNQGFFKSTDESALENEESAFLQVCTPCPDCSAGKYRPLDDACRQQQARSAPDCTDCPTGRYNDRNTSEWDAFCTRCPTCNIGFERTGCGLENVGTCTEWQTPVITKVSGPVGTSSGVTNGGDQLVISGLNFVGPRGGELFATPDRVLPTNDDIVVRYGGPTSDPATPYYYAKQCTIDPNCQLGGVCDITCLTSEGVGRDLPVEIFIFEGAASNPDSIVCASCKSALYTTETINYAEPLISEYEGTGSDLIANTVGGEDLIIKGANFGPPCGPSCSWIKSAVLVEIQEESTNSDRRLRRLDSETESEKVYPMDHGMCVVFSHTRMKCSMPEGAGPSFKVVVNIAGQSSVETAMSYGKPAITKVVYSSTNLEISNLKTRGGEFVTIVGKNLANTAAELDEVLFGSTELGQQTFSSISSTSVLSEPGTCQVKTAATEIECITLPGVLRGHLWTVQVGGQRSDSVLPTNYEEPTITSIINNNVENRILGAASLFRTEGGQAIVSGLNFGVTKTGFPIANVNIKVVLYPRGCCLDGGSGALELSVDIIEPEGDSDRLSFNMPAGYGTRWRLSLRISKSDPVTTPLIYAPWPLIENAESVNFGYQSPVIQQTKTTNTAGSKLRLSITGKNFCSDASCGTVYICNDGLLNESLKLCFAGGDKNNGPAEGVVAIQELSSSAGSDRTEWNDLEIQITPQNNNTYDRRFVFVQVGSDALGSRSDPAFQSSTKPEIHAICRGTLDNCGDYTSQAALKAPGVYPTNGIDIGTGNPYELILLVSQVETTDISGLRVSLGFPSRPPQEQLIISNSAVSHECVESDGQVTLCSMLVFRLPQAGWTGERQAVTLWVATIRSNSAYIDFEAPEISNIFIAGTTTPAVVSLPTDGSGRFDIVGTNFGSSSIPNPFSLTFGQNADIVYVQPGTGAASEQLCTEYTHTKLSNCRLPPGQGKNFRVTLKMIDHPAVVFPQFVPLLSYIPPVISSVSPANVETTGGTVVVSGSNMGRDMPLVRLNGRLVRVVSQQGGYHSSFSVVIPPGQGRDLRITVTAGGQESTPAMIHYNPPVVLQIVPVSSPTSGALPGESNRTIASIRGHNFGEANNTNVQILFRKQKDENSEPDVLFIAEGDDIVSVENHSIVNFRIPPGYGSRIKVFVVVAGQVSQPTSGLSFGYENPRIDSISLDCSGYDELMKDFVPNGRPCYGYIPSQFMETDDYPSVLSVVVSDDARSAVVLYAQSTKGGTGAVLSFTPQAGSSIVIMGMSGEATVLNREWNVLNSSSPEDGSPLQRQVTISLVSGGRPLTFSGADIAGRRFDSNGVRDSIARIGLTYVSSTSEGFRLLETDGCGAQATAQNFRSSGLEPFERWQDRNDQAGVSSGSVLLRECKQASVDRRQRLILDGSNFGKLGGAPITVTMQAKTCDCSTQLDGTPVPCMHNTLRACAPKIDGGECPADHTDCSTKSVDGSKVNSLTVELHEEDRIIVPTIPGFGRYHELIVKIGSVSASSEILRYHRPTVTGWISEGSLTGESNILRPDGVSRLCYLGHNFGKGAPEIMEPLIQVRIGSEYSVDGTPSEDLDTTMPLCSNVRWIESLTSGSDEYKGTSAICCSIPEGTVGARNHSVYINGQKDDCSTNELLCAFPENWPINRKEKSVTKEDFADFLRDTSSGTAPLFSCGRDSDLIASQSYGAVGELCLGVNSGVDHGKCKDNDCTFPQALAGYFRLDLDLQFACTAGTSKPCQDDVTVSDFDRVVVAGEDGDDLCFAASVSSNGTSTCADSQHRCSNKGSDAVAPGKCVFRRPKEARRALGSSYRFWGSPEDLSSIERLEPRCNEKRFEHLLDPSVYSRYPGLKQSPTCYDIVACNPKTSCLGDNKCAPEYQWMKPKCELWQEQNPDKNVCTSDDQCRSRSGSTDGAFGLSSACSRNHPEDCARCNFDLSNSTDPVTGERQGVCECVGGAPRCGLCTQPVKYDDEDREDVKGFFRLNNECQECPDDPILILVGILLVVIMGSIACWWLQSKKINISIITIGFDYFQVLAIFARINVKWPAWVKSLLQVLSILNFNIDIAGPECAFPDFDYREKWIVTILFPVIFAAALFFVFCFVAGWKFVKSWCRLSSKKQKYTSHGPRLIATFLLIVYCLYLSVCRRALDVFNCNPPDPPDGYLYTEFVSIECEAGICKCDDPSELQAQLKPYAALALIIYAIGFPCFVAYITYFYRIQMKLDQLLRAHGLGDSREDSIHGVDFESRKCGSKSKQTYQIRKKYNMLYYHFKPGKVYWMVVILSRKFMVALCALMFRANVGFMLATILLILFFNYVLAAKHHPFMSTMERTLVLLRHREKANEADELMRRGKTHGMVPRDAMLHFQLQEGIFKLQKELSEREANRKKGAGFTSLEHAKVKGLKEKKQEKHYYFDYNTLDRVLIACAIFLSIIGLMFESRQFYITDTETGLEVLNPASASFYNTVLVCAAIVLFGSILYYTIVFIAEVAGALPKWVLFCFASKKSRHAKAAEMLSAYPSLNEGAIQMSINPALKGQIGVGASIAKADANKAENELKQLMGEVNDLDTNQKALADEYRRLKAQGAREKLRDGGKPRDRRRQKKTKQQFKPQHVTD